MNDAELSLLLLFLIVVCSLYGMESASFFRLLGRILKGRNV